MKNSRFGLFKLNEPLFSFVVPPFALVVVADDAVVVGFVVVVVVVVVEDEIFAFSLLLLLFCGRCVEFDGLETVRISTGNDCTRIAVGRNEKPPRLGAGPAGLG